MADQFFSPEGDIQNYFVDEYWLIDQYIGNSLWAWGYNGNGQLGTNNTSQKNTPVTIFTGGTNWKQVSSGGYHTLAIKTDGTLWVWGYNYHRQLGTNDITSRSTPVTTFAGGTNWKQVSSVGYHTAAIKTDGTLWVWGTNSDGRLGTNDTITRYTPVTTFAGGTNWKQVSGGRSHTAAIKTDGTLWTWGRSSEGQLGRFSISADVRSTPITTFAGGTNWADTATGVAEELYTLSAGLLYATAIKTDGTLWTWGRGSNGRLGTNDAIARSTPVTTFAGGTNWKQVSSGREHTAAIKTDGTLWTWGYNGQWQLGTNDTNSKSTPVTTFAGGTNWKQVSSGGYHTAAIKTDGTLWVWGTNSDGRLGTNDTITRYTPVTTFAGGSTWRQISSGRYHTTAIKTDGTLWVWGYNGNGQLATNDASNRFTPITTFTGGTNWKQVSAGREYTAAIKTDGTLWTWGEDSNGQLGRINDNSLTPVTTFAGGTNWADTATGASEELYTLSAGNYHTAAIKTDGTLWIWGDNANGYLGINDETGDPRFTPVTTFAGGTDWKQVALGYYSVTAGIKTDGTLWLWGYNGNGYLGNNSNNYSYAYTPVTTFAGGTNWKQVSAGQYPVAAIKTDGTLWAWGNNDDGQLGTNNLDDKFTPVTTFAGGTDWKQVSCGDYHVAAIKTDGTLWVWGYNYHRQLGTNDITSRSTPVTTFAGGTNWKQVSGGASYTAAIKTDGTLWTWGYNGYGQLGTNDYDDKSTPVTTFAGGTNWKQVSAGKGYPAQTAAIKTDGTLWLWGYNYDAQLGTNDLIDRSTPVTTFAGGTNWKQVNCGYRHTVALQDDGVNKKLYVFGSNEYGALGFVSKNYKPGEVFGNTTNWKQVSSGGYHTTAITTDGTLWVWGTNSNGQLGVNDTTQRNTPVTTFAGGTDWKQVHAGYYNTIALQDDGVNKRLYMWGSNTYATLGNNYYSTNHNPSQTFFESYDWKQVSAGGFHTTAIKTDGTLWTWGRGDGGELGTNDITDRSTPVTTFAGGSNWKQISSGGYHTSAIKTDGTLWVWGYNDQGQLGANDTFARSTPVTTFAGGTNWKQINVGRYHTSAIKTDGTLWVWGYNGNTQLGTNDTNSKSTPVTTFAGGTNWKQVSAGKRHTAAVKSGIEIDTGILINT